MKLTEKYVEHLYGMVTMYLGSRNQALRPHNVRARGVLASADRELLTVYILESQSEKVLQNLNENGKFSLTAGSVVNFETYQFKGNFVSSRPSDANDEAVQAIYSDKILGLVGHGAPHLLDIMKDMIVKPMISITLNVQEIFEQSPGPGTGNKISQ